MLLRSVKAANFRDYEEITIPEIPSSGALIVEEEDASEPFVLRDLISYAFFAQTPDGSSAPDDIISPGARLAWVEVEFDHPATGPASLRRGVDSSGASKVSLLLRGSGRVFDSESEVAAAVVGLLGLNEETLAARFLTTDSADDASGPDLKGLRKDRKRIKRRLSRAQARLEDLLAGDVGRDASRAESLRTRLEEFEAKRATLDPEARSTAALDAISALSDALLLAVKRRERADARNEVDALRGLLTAEQARTGRVVSEAAEERRLVGRRLGRVVEYRGGLEDLRQGLLSADLGCDADRIGEDGIEEVGRVIRQREGADEPPRHLKRAIWLGIGALALFSLAVLLRLTLDPRGPWVTAVSAFLAVVIFVDVILAGWAVFAFRASERRSGRADGDEPAFDPLPLLDRIEREYADVIPEYGPELKSELEAELAELERMLTAGVERGVLLQGAIGRLGGEAEIPRPSAGEAPPRAPLTLEDIELAARRGEELLALAAEDLSQVGAPVHDVLESLCLELSGLLDAAAREDGPVDVLSGAGLEDDLPEDAVVAVVASLTAEVGALRAEAEARTASDGEGEELARELKTAEVAAAQLEAVRDRIRESELMLSDAELGIEAARDLAETVGDAEILESVAPLLKAGGFLAYRVENGDFVGVGENGSEAEVERNGPLGRALAMALALANGKRTGAGGGFLALADEALGAIPREAGALEGFVGLLDPGAAQILVLTGRGRWTGDLVAKSKRIEGGGLRLALRPRNSPVRSS